jgi:NitT/TauT family transport system substrate-binding protein
MFAKYTRHQVYSPSQATRVLVEAPISEEAEMKKLKRMALPGVVALLAVSALAACGSSDEDGGDKATAGAATDTSDNLSPRPLSKRVTVTMAQVGAIMSNFPVYVADAKGEFDKENIDLKLETVPIPDNLLVVERGDADFTNGTVSAGILNVQAAGKNVRIAFPVNTSGPGSKFGLWVNKKVAGADGKVQPEELKGLTIYGPSGPNVSLYYFLEPINAASSTDTDVTPQDVTLKTLASADVSQSLANGAIEAGLVLDPFWLELQKDDCCVWVSGKPDYPVSGYLFGPSLLEGQPDVGAAVTRALSRTIRDHLQEDWTKNPELVAIASKYTQQPAEALTALPADNYGSGEPEDMAARLDKRYLDGAQAEFAARKIAGAPMLTYDKPLTYDQVFYTGFFDELAK